VSGVRNGSRAGECSASVGDPFYDGADVLPPGRARVGQFGGQARGDPAAALTGLDEFPR
jgi:hypothetical protein